MIHTETIHRTVIQCDTCPHAFEGAFGEDFDEVVAYARDRTWLVSGAPGQTLCPDCQKRRDEANQAATGRVSIPANPVQDPSV